MKYLLAFLLAISSVLVHCGADTYEDNNDFADFEDFEDEEIVVEVNQEQTIPSSSAKIDPDDDVVVEDEENEFEHFNDEEEFEGFSEGYSDPKIPEAKKTEPKLTVAKVPIHFRTHWDSYWMEMIMIAGLLAYFANYLYGNKKNSTLANMWLTTHKALLEENFILVGDDGRKETESSTMSFVKESESIYTLWCSGRTCCEGMLVELRMIKRQDLLALIIGLVKPVQDQLQIKVEMSKDAMDSFVFCIASKKLASKMLKEMNDLNKFCSLVNKAEEKFNISYSILSEIPEVTSALLDSRLLAALNKFSHLIDFIHISDQYSGPIQNQDNNQSSTETTLKQPDVKKMLICGFTIPANADMEEMKPLLVLVFYLMERVKRFRLSKEAKNKSEKNRLRVEEEFLKTTHAIRVEQARERREEKRKQEKERILAEEDPDKQKRWEKKEQKRQSKKQAPKMKQLSIKAL